MDGITNEEMRRITENLTEKHSPKALILGNLMNTMLAAERHIDNLAVRLAYGLSTNLMLDCIAAYCTIHEIDSNDVTKAAESLLDLSKTLMMLDASSMPIDDTQAASETLNKLRLAR